MRMGCVGADAPLGRKNGMSRQKRAAVGQSVSVAQKAEQKPVVMLVGVEKHWPLWQYIIASVPLVGASGQAAPAVRAPKATRHVWR
jgi:hypothetical protein